MSYLFKSCFNDFDCIFNTVGSDTFQDTVKSDGDSYVAKISIPGIPKYKLSIEATEEELTVSKGDKLIRRITLGGLVDIDKISSDLDLGILEITLPKKESQRPRKVKIN